MDKIQCPAVVYDSSMDYDCGQGGLRIYIPDGNGCINYNLVRSVVPEKNADIRRMTIAFETDAYGNPLRQLTKERAEWEMAIRLADRPDFIGGYNHGDERETAFSLWIDGEEYAETALKDGVFFKELKVQISSIGYDPKSQSNAVFEHEKFFCFTDKEARISQKIKWLGRYELDQKFKSFLAMMPPLKHEVDCPENTLTDTFYTDKIPQTPIENLPLDLGKTSRYSVLGTGSRLCFTMEVQDYQPLYQNSYLATLSDNGGNNYNKMYIAFAGGAIEAVEAGTVWNSVTCYKIKHIT